MEDDKFKEIQALMYDASDLELDIYDYIKRMIVCLGYAIQNTIYMCLLEDGHIYPEERDQRMSMQNGSFICLGKLVKLGVLSSNSEDGCYHDDTVFFPLDTEKFNYFSYDLSNARKDADAYRFVGFGVQASILDGIKEAKEDREE